MTGLCYCEIGHEVLCVESDIEKMKSLRRGRSPIREAGVDGLLDKHLRSRRLRISGDTSDLDGTDFTFICVGTPLKKDGSLDLSAVREAAASIGEAIAVKEGHHIVVVKSTVPPTTTEELVLHSLETSSGKKAGRDFGLAVNPEFMKEGSAVEDFMKPDRIVIGGLDERSVEMVRGIYSSFTCPFVEVDLSTAEMIKVASNAFLASKVSFMNEIGNLCKVLGIDVRGVARGMGYDRRIGMEFLSAGCGFGGSCLPKDVSGLAFEARKRGQRPYLLESILKVNALQPLRMIQLLERHIDPKGRKVAVLGLAFKPNTDDIRDARSKIVVEELLRRGAAVKCHDPEAMDNFRKEFPDLEYCSSAKKCVRGSDAVMIVTEWPEYADPSLYGSKLVIDGRGVVRTENYEGICW